MIPSDLNSKSHYFFFNAAELLNDSTLFQKTLSPCCLCPRRLGMFISGVRQEVKRLCYNLNDSHSSESKIKDSFQEVSLFSSVSPQ